MADAKAKEKPIASLIAGATAGGVEAFITYPLENLKTQLQFGGPNGAVSRRAGVARAARPLCPAPRTPMQVRHPADDDRRSA